MSAVAGGGPLYEDGAFGPEVTGFCSVLAPPPHPAVIHNARHATAIFLDKLKERIGSVRVIALLLRSLTVIGRFRKHLLEVVTAFEVRSHLAHGGSIGRIARRAKADCTKHFF